MVKAFRDTWHDGIHSYLGYLRDRLIVARDLLSESGSCFVQISDENVHKVRAMMEEVFGAENYVVTIVVKKKGGTTPTDPVNDYILWTSKKRECLNSGNFMSGARHQGQDLNSQLLFRLMDSMVPSVH